MSSLPDISVCIPAYNAPETFARCLGSVLAQRGVALECVVSDDSDTDDVRRHVEQQNDARIVYAGNTPALGAPRNWNAAIAMARGRVITLLHQDDWYRSENLLCAVYGRMAEKGAEVLVAGRAIVPEGADSAWEYPQSDATVAVFRAGFPARTLVVNELGSPSVVFFARALADVAYDEKLLYFSDTEYYARLFDRAKSAAAYPPPEVAIGRGAARQLSAGCLASLAGLVRELACALGKSGAGNATFGLALARFLAANARHWKGGGIMPALATARSTFPLPALAVAAASFPVFAAHMAYRLLYRFVHGRPWG